ncbi:MAG: hypothetical protein KatS3mg027_1009 [Bacteroidia bacterium]|nr:MAG: hypothetical protein KatS3mg027_1009 [Bacteroidia bacterium]
MLVFGCKKQNKLNEKDISSTSIQQDKRIEKFYFPSKDKMDEIIKQMASLVNKNKNTFKISSNQNYLPLDSSLWVLETYLNYFFDKQLDKNYLSFDSITCEVQVEKDAISKDTLSVIYYKIYSYIISKNYQVKAIDIFGEQSEENKVKIKSLITLYEDSNNSNYKTNDDPCALFSNSFNCDWSTQYATYYSCSTGLDGPTLVEGKLNCLNYNFCSNNYYWTNVQTSYNSPINDISIAPYTLYNIKCNTNTCLVLNSIYVNAYGNPSLNSLINSIKSLGNLKKPNSNYYIINYDVVPFFYVRYSYSDGCPPNTLKLYWNINITYGIPYCNIPNG